MHFNLEVATLAMQRWNELELTPAALGPTTDRHDQQGAQP
jgi:hypothetical protein